MICAWSVWSVDWSCVVRKLCKTGFEFWDNLAGGEGTRCWCMAGPRFAFWIISSELGQVVIMNPTCLCSSASQSKSNPVPGIASSDSIRQQAYELTNSLTHPGAWQRASDKPTGPKRRRSHPNAHAYAHASAVASLAHKWVASTHFAIAHLPCLYPSCIVIRKQTGKEASLI